MKKIKTLFALTCPFFAAIFLTQCGSGKGDVDDETVRPKTMQDLVLTIDGTMRFEFIPSMNSLRAIKNGDVETGTFIYTQGGPRVRVYPNTRGDRTNCAWPERLANITYSYRALNNAGGTLTLNATPTGTALTPDDIPANIIEDNESFTSFFRFSSPSPEGEILETNEIVIDINFSAQGPVIQANDITIRIPGSPAPLLDTMQTTSTILLESGAPVPINYNPTPDPDRPSRIVPDTLDNRVLNATNGIPNPSLDFTLQFTRDAGGVGFIQESEIGTGILRVIATAIDDAVDYEWQPIGGTDTGELTLSNSGTIYDGRYLLIFFGTDVGEYVGANDQTSGTFNLIAAP